MMREEGEFIRGEMARYGVNALLSLREGVEECSISRSGDGTLTIAAGSESALLHGVYALAELSGWSFLQPGKDLFSPRLAENFPRSGELTLPPPRLKRRGVCFDGRGNAPALLDWMGKNRMDLLVWQAAAPPAPEICGAAGARGIEILREPKFFTLGSRCINHTVAESGCELNREFREQLQKGGAAGKLIFAEFLAPGDHAPLPLIYFDELFCEAEFFARHGAAGAVMPGDMGDWQRYGINAYLFARSAAGEDKLTAIDRVFQAEYANGAICARRFFAAMKNLLLATGKCLTASPEELYRSCCMEEIDQLEEYLAEWETPPELSRWVREIRDDFQTRLLTK